MKRFICQIIRKLPHVRGIVAENAALKEEFNSYKEQFYVPPGHFYSPFVSVDKLKTNSDFYFSDKKNSTLGFDLQEKLQISFVQSLLPFYEELPFPEEKTDGIRYFYNNTFYSYTDGIILFCVLRKYSPQKVIEVGSGFSSAIMLDTNDIFFKEKMSLTFIEPHPERLLSLLSEKDKSMVNLIKKEVQFVDLEIFQNLNAGDILFIDSSHVVKTGSDVNHLLFNVLPKLKKGVLIHFHDIFYNFEYPQKWIFEGRNWNELYLLRSFLMFNDEFDIKLFSNHLHRTRPEAFENMPLCTKNFGGSFWLEKK